MQSDQEDEKIEIKSTPKRRKKIHKIIEDVNLCAETQEALREEEERCERLANRDSQMEDRREVLYAQQVKQAIKVHCVHDHWIFTVV